MRTPLAALLLLSACSTGGSPGNCATLAGTRLQGQGQQVQLHVRIVGVQDGFGRRIGINWDLNLDSQPADAPAGAASAQGEPLVVDEALVGGGAGDLYFVPRSHRAASFLPLVLEGLQPPAGSGLVFPMLAGAPGACLTFDPLDVIVPTGLAGGYAASNVVWPLPPHTFGATVLDDAGVLAFLAQLQLNEVVIDFRPLTLSSGQSALALVENTQAPIADFAPAVRNAILALEPQAQFANSGPALVLQATVKPGGEVELEFRPAQVGLVRPQQAFDLGSTSSTMEMPTVGTGSIQTTIVLSDGQTIVIGGQKLTGDPDLTEGVPLFGQVPLLGSLFQPWSPVKEEHALMILITPRIILLGP